MFVEYSLDEIEQLLNAESMPKKKIVSKRTLQSESSEPRIAPQPKPSNGSINIKQLAQKCDVKKYKSGHKLYNKGDKITEMYLILQGKISIVLDGKAIKSLGAGDLVGEAACISGKQTDESAEFSTDGIAILVKKDNLQEVISLEPALGYKLLDLLGRYIQQLLNEIEILKNI